MTDSEFRYDGERLHARGEQAALRFRLAGLAPEFPPLPGVKLQMLDYQLLALYILAQRLNRAGARILEIGTGRGGSGYVLSRAAPRARILSLTTSEDEAASAGRLWREKSCPNVGVKVAASWDVLALDPRETGAWDMVFVDGDHNRIARDLPWFNRLHPGGLFLCHDYSPQHSRTPSAIVYAELNAAAARLGRPFDVLLVDEGDVGMAGFYRLEGEEL